MHNTFTAHTEAGDTATVDLCDGPRAPIVITIKGKTGGFSYLFLTRDVAEQINRQLPDRVKTVTAAPRNPGMALAREVFGLSEGPATDRLRTAPIARDPDCAVSVMQAGQCRDIHNLTIGDEG